MSSPLKQQSISPFWQGVVGSAIPVVIFLIGVAYQSGRLSEKVDSHEKRIAQLELWRNTPTPKPSVLSERDRGLATLTYNRYEELPSLPTTELVPDW